MSRCLTTLQKICRTGCVLFGQEPLEEVLLLRCLAKAQHVHKQLSARLEVYTLVLKYEAARERQNHNDKKA